jgi:hypothetical protein
MPIQDRQLDFEDFSTDAEKLSAIMKRIEVSSCRHKLSSEYYRYRKLALLFPGILACLAIGIIGFVVTTDVVKLHMKIWDVVQIEDVLTLVIGFLGVFVGTDMLLMNQWDFGGRHVMHDSAMSEMNDLGNRVRYWKMDRRVGGGEGGGGDGVGGTDDDAISFRGGGTKNGTGNGGTKTTTRNDIPRALGVVEAPDTRRMAMILAGGKKFEDMEGEIKKRTNAARMAENWKNDVSR